MQIFISNNKAYIAILLGLAAWYIFIFVFNGKNLLTKNKNKISKNIKNNIVESHNFNNLANGNEIEEEDYPMTGKKSFKTSEFDAESEHWGDTLKIIKEQHSQMKHSTSLQDLLGEAGINPETDKE